MTWMRVAIRRRAISTSPIELSIAGKIGARRADGARRIGRTRKQRSVAFSRSRPRQLSLRASPAVSLVLDEGRGVGRVLLLLFDRLLFLRRALRLLLAFLRWLMR